MRRKKGRKKKKRKKKKEETTAVKYKPFGVAMPCGLTRLSNDTHAASRRLRCDNRASSGVRASRATVN